MAGSDKIVFEEEPAAGGGGGSAYPFPHANSDGTVTRQILLDGQVWITTNAAWDGSQWVKDVPAYSAGGYQITSDGINLLTQYGGVSTWAPYDWATQMSLGPNGQIVAPGQIRAVFCAEFQSTATSGSYGGVVNFPKSFPYTPSSFTWSTSYTSGITGGPYVAVTQPYGLGWYVTYSGAGDRYYGGYVTVS